jgi:transcription antitermination factor NusG
MYMHYARQAALMHKYDEQWYGIRSAPSVFEPVHSRMQQAAQQHRVSTLQACDRLRHRPPLPQSLIHNNQKVSLRVC